uniref:RBBP8 N-terminal-like protein isoform X2 n=1 Tax=Semicossyphus pulcher TaxID=241346 RepID=UPI0037E99B50
MECFNSLLLKLREVHEREVEGWQMKIQELSNKKGCDTKRMEELFTKNQQMKEQQRLLTENIKTLENRLRAGLCDRCTVTQEVAKRRQHEFEASQIQSLQHISLLAAEMNNLKKENRRFRDEIRSLRAALEGHSDLSSPCSSTEVKPSSSPELSPSSGPVALISTAPSRGSIQPAGGDFSVKTEAEHRPEDGEQRPWRGANRSHFDPYKPLTPPSWKTEQHRVPRVGERRAQTVEGLDQPPSVPPHTLPLKNSSSSSGGDMNPSRHVLHPSVPCRPQPIKSSPVPLPWPLSESSDWVSAPGTSVVIPPHLKSNLLRFPSLIQTGQPAGPRRPAFGSPWHKQNTLKPPPKEPTVLFRLRSLPGQGESQNKLQEKKETSASRAERGSIDGLREACEGPLDLSERGKIESNQTPREYSPLTSHAAERVQVSPDRDLKTHPSVQSPEASPSLVAPPSSSSSSPAKQHEEEPPTRHKHKEVTEQRDELNGQAEPRNGKKVPVLTLSLRPVVVLETLNSAMQKQESANSKSSSPAAETVSSSEGQDEEEEGESSPETDQGRKRKRASVETETDRDSETDNIRPERKIQISVRSEEESPS